jgi:hypothetical protein
MSHATPAKGRPTIAPTPVALMPTPAKRINSHKIETRSRISTIPKKNQCITPPNLGFDGGGCTAFRALFALAAFDPTERTRVAPAMTGSMN